MDKTIRIDDDVYAALQKQAEPFTDTPNSTLRRILGLDTEQRRNGDDGQSVYLVPNGPQYFESVEELRDFLKKLRERPVPNYNAATDYFWRNVKADSVCLFHKNRYIVGEGKMSGRIKPYTGTETSTVTGRPFAGEINFIPATIRLYKRPVSFAEAAATVGKKLSFRGFQKLSMDDYSAISSIAAKDGYE